MAIAPFGDDALQPHNARLPEHEGAVHTLDMVTQPNASTGLGEDLH